MKHPTCGIMVSFFLKSCSPIFLMFIPSITIPPVHSSSMRNRANVNELLPAPVRPLEIELNLFFYRS
jgi:hypothetical protein